MGVSALIGLGAHFIVIAKKLLLKTVLTTVSSSLVEYTQVIEILRSKELGKMIP